MYGVWYVVIYLFYLILNLLLAFMSKLMLILANLLKGIVIVEVVSRFKANNALTLVFTLLGFRYDKLPTSFLKPITYEIPIIFIVLITSNNL